jgi:hypothetical protein
MIDSLAGEERLWAPLLPQPVVRDRLERIRAIVEEAAEHQRENQLKRLLEAPLNDQKVVEFCRSVRRGWRGSRLTAGIFAGAGKYVREFHGPARQNGFFGVDRWLPKEWLISDSPLHFDSETFDTLGHSVARGEDNLFVSILSGATLIDTNGDGVISSLNVALEEMRAQGFNPTLIVAPVNWQLRRAFGLSPGNVDLSALPYELPEKARHWFAGTVQGLPCFTVSPVPPDRFFVVDVFRFSTWYQNSYGRFQDEIDVSVRLIPEDEARTLAIESPEITAETSDGSIESRVIETRRRVFATVRERFHLVVMEPRAACAVRIPPGIREE